MGRYPHVHTIEQQTDYDIARMALEQAGVLALEDRFYPTLSGGEQQRVQFARALAQIWHKQTQANRYLLLDEPTSSLDLAHQHRMLSLVRDLTEQNVGIFCVMHDLNLAAQYADHILVLKNGQQIAYGAPTTALTPEIVSSTFGIEVLQTKHPHKGYPMILPA